MGPLKCCVGDCTATSESHRLFSFPKNDHFRNLWLSFLVPSNSFLIGLSKEQLRRKRVCEKHFDKKQFDHEGRRLRYSYPSLFTANEVAHRVPLALTAVVPTDEHNYAKSCCDNINVTEQLVAVTHTELDINYEHSYIKEQAGSSHDKKQVASSSKQIADEITDASVVVIEQAEMNSNDLAVSQMMHEDLEIDSDADLISEMIHKDSEITSKSEVFRQTIQNRKHHTKKQKGFNMQKFGSKKRKLIKQIVNIATDSCGDSASQRVIQAQSLLRNKELFEDFFLLNQQAQMFVMMQLKQARKNKMARRYNLDEKLMALLLMKQSPKGYKLLEKMFTLPNKRTLNRLAEKISIKPGFNPKIFEHIRTKTKSWNENQKLCTIVFDEVALTPHLTFNENKNVINGFVDIAGERKLKFCDHALVFMVRGICSSWRQSVSYYFCEGTVSVAELQNILKQLVEQISLTGLIPLGLVCDQGSTFRTAIRKFREDTVRIRINEGLRDDGSVHIAGHDLSVFFDPPHLLKGLRNNFLTKDIIWEGKTASWKDIQLIFDLDSQLGHTRALPKLTAHHVDPKKIKKMKVSVAAQVLSSRTAAMLKYTNALKNFHNTNADNTMATTADVVEFFDMLFDSVNGYPGGMKRGKLRRAVKKNSPHHTFWNEAIQKLKKLVFVDKHSKFAIQAGKPRLMRVPSLLGWITTVESFVRVSNLLFNKYGVEYYYPRRINQDPLENFFGRIRALNYRNVNPDTNIFIYAYKSLVLSNILSPHSKLSNCEEDNGKTLLDVSFLFESENKENENFMENQTKHNNTSIPSSSQERPRNISLVDQIMMEKIKVQCSAYTAGYICRKITNKISCKSCKKTITSCEEENIHSYIRFREYKSLKNFNLCYPNGKFIVLYRESSQLIHNYLNVNCFQECIRTKIKIKLLTLDYSWLGCAKHNELLKKNYINIIIRVQVHNWCNLINKILKGDITEKYVVTMGEPQKLALRKYITNKLRKKCIIE